MAAPLVPIAISLVAELVPELLRLFDNDNAAAVAEKVGDIAKTVAGTKDVTEAEQMIKADPSLAIQFKQAVMAKEIELERISLQREELYVKDIQDARKYRDEKVFWLGISIMLTFAFAIGMVLAGIYELATGKEEIKEGTLAVVTGFVGTIVGYVAANAQAVVNYFFGSSHGSMQKSDDLADTIKNIKKG